MLKFKRKFRRLKVNILLIVCTLSWTTFVTRFSCMFFSYPVIIVVIAVRYRLSVSPRILISCFVYSRVFILSCSYHSRGSCYCSLYFMSLYPHCQRYYLFDIYYVQCQVHTNVYYLISTPAY